MGKAGRRDSKKMKTVPSPKKVMASVSWDFPVTLFTDCTETVSYTHLDVYKRQGEHSSNK